MHPVGGPLQLPGPSSVGRGASRRPAPGFCPRNSRPLLAPPPSPWLGRRSPGGRDGDQTRPRVCGSEPSREAGGPCCCVGWSLDVGANEPVHSVHLRLLACVWPLDTQATHSACLRDARGRRRGDAEQREPCAARWARDQHAPEGTGPRCPGAGAGPRDVRCQLGRQREGPGRRNRQTCSQVLGRSPRPSRGPRGVQMAAPPRVLPGTPGPRDLT